MSTTPEFIVLVMSRPDPPELRGLRKFRWCYPGDSARRDVIKRDLAQAYLQWRLHDLAAREGGSIVSVRRQPKARVA